MTIKEAVKHCYEVLERNDLCEECKKEHLQLAHWLERLEKLEEENEALKMGIENLHTDYKELKETSEFVIEKFKISNKNLIYENEKLKKVIETWIDKIKIRPDIDYVYTYAKFSYEEFENIEEYLYDNTEYLDDK